ncbi:ABC transporter ATP-binding protein [Bradyrhizobium sp. HKCCYLS2033]|uniref:ABC transporter ATP-binding protein n=1 Tax=unclassified Bradyrhizobium TaxID=2631580 RepID=UPI003EBDA4D9
MASVRLDKVYKQFGATAVLDGIDLEIADGEFVVLVGPSGCGKSTLLNVVAGLETLSEGRVRIGDRIVDDVPPKDRNIAMVFQSYSLYPTKTVRDNILFGMVTRRIPEVQQQQALARVTELLHIEQLLQRKPGQLSGGQRQRVAMGRALVREPDVFLFDEPLSNLDAKLRVEMRTEIKKLHARLGQTIIYVTHDQVEAMTLASRIAVMDNGRIRQFAAPETVYEQPADLFVAGFMGSPAMNLVPARVVQGDGIWLEVEDARGNVRLAVPPGASASIGTHVGRHLKLGLRPEIITRQGTQKPSGLLCTFQRPVDVVEPTGPDTMIVFDLGGVEMIARVHPEDKAPVGSLYSFEVNMDKAKLFDPDSGKRV